MTAPTTNRTTDILKALGIKKLYWIDDKFYEGGEANSGALAIAASDAIAGAILAKVDVSSISSDLAAFADTGLDRAQIAVHVQEYIDKEDLDNQQLKAILDKLDALSSQEDDLHDDQFSGFEELLNKGSIEIVKLSFGQWVQTKADLVSNNEALYLIDYENKRENNGISGHDILEHLAGLDISPFSIVFTHICEPESEQAKATDFYEKLQKAQRDSKPYRRFSVMSKKRLRVEQELDELDAAFAPPLKRLAIGHTYRHVAAACLAGYEQGTAEAIDKLDSMPVNDMYRAIFERTWEEGASEIDVICRILNAAQRKGVFDAVVAATKTGGVNFFPALTALRKVSDIAIASDTATIDPYIQQLHEVEVFDLDIINSMHLPLSCGDIFQKSINGKFIGPKYILLAPPCDLMVRTDNADRNAAEGIFVLLKESVAGAAQASEEKSVGVNSQNPGHKKYEITKLNGSTLFADFHRPFTVNLSVLDFCVWNKNGEVRFNRITPPRESRMFLEGWVRRLRDVIQKCGNSFPSEYRALCFIGGPDEFKERSDPQNGDLIFPLKRICRLRSPYAEAVLSEYLGSLGRPAFDHSLAD